MLGVQKSQLNGANHLKEGQLELNRERCSNFKYFIEQDIRIIAAFEFNGNKIAILF